MTCDMIVGSVIMKKKQARTNEFDCVENLMFFDGGGEQENGYKDFIL